MPRTTWSVRRALATISVGTLLVAPTAVAAAATGGIRPLDGWPLDATQVQGMPGSPTAADLPNEKSASGATCRNYFFPVTMKPNSAKTYRVFGQLCTANPRLLGRQPVQLLMHGGSYNHEYYDWPHLPEQYNYVRHMTRAGYTTLNLDRLGYGHSDHPPAQALNFDVAALNAHQVVQYLRQGALGPRFSTIVTNGYSMGGLTAQVEAARYHDVDAVMVHAVGHGLLTPRSGARLGTLVYPAALDKKFADQTWTAGYLTTLPGKRDVFFGPDFDQAQLEYEDRFKDIVAPTELSDITMKTYTDLTKDIVAPVFWSPGRYDKIWCGTTDDCLTDPMTANEEKYYRPGVFTKYVVPETGHGVVLGYGVSEYIERSLDWLRKRGIQPVGAVAGDLS